jgi:hypothetical protein
MQSVGRQDILVMAWLLRFIRGEQGERNSADNVITV